MVPPAKRPKSTFHGTYHSALHEIFLCEGVHHQNGERGDKNNRVFDVLSQRRRVGRHGCGAVPRRAAAHDDIPQQKLQWIFGAVVHIEQARNVGVPEAHRVEQHDGSHSRLGQGQDDLPENDQIVCPVQVSGFMQRIRYGLKACPHDNHIPDADCPRKHHCPDGILQMQGGYHHVIGHQAGIEEHSEGDNKCEDSSSIHIFPGQGIGAQGGQNRGNRRAHHRILQGIPEGPHHRLIGQRNLIGLQIDSLWI